VGENGWVEEILTYFDFGETVTGEDLTGLADLGGTRVGIGLDRDPLCILTLAPKGSYAW
jgi:hypothetical protein